MTAAEPIDDQAVERLLATSPVFGTLDGDTRTRIAKELELRTLARGAILMREGEAADGMYLVASGRFQASITVSDGSQQLLLNEIGRGELAGEMALLTERPRSATVVASRDSYVLFLSTAAFMRVVQAHPQALRVITGAVVERLTATIHGQQTTSPATTITIVPLDDGTNGHELAANLLASLRAVAGDVVLVDEKDADDALGKRATALERATWREQLEATRDVVVYRAHPRYDAWTDSCVRSADILLLVASANGHAGRRPIEDDIRNALGSVQPRVELVLLHEPTTRWPSGTARWLGGRDVERHHHVRVDRSGDVDRLARLLAGRAVGIVFGGGGARGIAHVGVLRALRERGMAVDAAAGASIGAIVAGAVARGDSPDELAVQLRAAVLDRSPLDVTLPTVALASGGRVTRSIVDAAQQLDMEDTWLNFRCVSTNLTRGALEIHDRGPAWAAVRASFAVPGLFPPMRNAADEVLVDGGIVDNLPVACLRAAHPGISVIAVDVGVRREFISSVPATGVVSGWRHLVEKTRRREFNELTTLPKILLRLTELSSLGDDDRGDCYIRPDLTGVSLLDFDKFDDLVAIGERGARLALDEWDRT